MLKVQKNNLIALFSKQPCPPPKANPWESSLGRRRNSFLGVAFVGSLLRMLPFSRWDRVVVAKGVRLRPASQGQTMQQEASRAKALWQQAGPHSGQFQAAPTIAPSQKSTCFGSSH